MPRQFCPHRKIGTSVNQKSHDGKATVSALCCCMKYGGLPSDSIFIDGCLAVHLGATIQQQPDSIQISKLRGYVEKCRSTNVSMRAAVVPKSSAGNWRWTND